MMVNVKVKPNTCHVRIIGIGAHLLSEASRPTACLAACCKQYSSASYKTLPAGYVIAFTVGIAKSIKYCLLYQ